MIVVTGAAGFIGSAVVWQLNQMDLSRIIAVDALGSDDRWRNLNGLTFTDYVDRDDLPGWLEAAGDQVEAVIHMGACAATTELDTGFLLRNNYEYTKRLWRWCTLNGKRFIYASSAATYGMGDQGYGDDHERIASLRPLNPYGWSKHRFDCWALAQTELPPQWVGLKFFNVYGPNEYHKGSMASVAFHGFNQIRSTGRMQLFESHREGICHGEQARDFVYIKDVVKALAFFLENRDRSGIFNVGTGKARTFNDLARATFAALGLEPRIEYIPMPEELRPRYQYYTAAPIAKLRLAGYTAPFFSLEDGVKEYIQGHLLAPDPYLR